MQGYDKMTKLAQLVLAYSTAEQTEVVLLSEDTQLTRFANSAIHQNVAERNVEVRVRATAGKRIGVASVNNLQDEALERVAQQALQLALLQPENPDFVSLPAPRPLSEVAAFVRATADYGPEQRAAAVGTICALAKDRGFVASGAFATTTAEVCVHNSLGVQAYAPTTISNLTTVVMSEDSSGYASAASPDVREIDPVATGREAVDKAVRSRKPRAIEPTECPVVLEEYAVAELLMYIAYLGFGALSVHEGRSFMANRLGQQITGTNISIWDDGLDGSGMPMPFDFEGTPKQRVDIISRGKANAVVYDSFNANRDGTESTGHALPAPNTEGPLPTNLFMQRGNASKPDMCAAISRGLWVTRFHYVNPVHPRKAILTGMTRDGTFWIEDGEIVGAVKNLRFTQGILEALSEVRMISSETKLVSDYLGAVRVPALLIDRFAFTGATEF